MTPPGNKDHERTCMPGFLLLHAPDLTPVRPAVPYKAAVAELVDALP